MTSKRKQKSIETKEKIIEHAMILYKELGYDNVKVSDICKASGTSIGGFYHHFKSKEDTINQVYIGFDDYLENLLENKKFNSYSEAILFIIENQLMYSKKGGHQIALMIFMLQLTSLRKEIIEENRYIYLTLKKYINKGIESGEFKNNVDVQHVAQWILRTSRGVIYDWCLREGNYDLVQTALNDVLFIINHSLLLSH